MIEQTGRSQEVMRRSVAAQATKGVGMRHAYRSARSLSRRSQGFCSRRGDSLS
jgi:hypothetical protein